MTWDHMQMFLSSLSLFSSEINRKHTVRKGMHCQCLDGMYPSPVQKDIGEVYACGEHVPYCAYTRTQNRHSLETS